MTATTPPHITLVLDPFGRKLLEDSGRGSGHRHPHQPPQTGCVCRSPDPSTTRPRQSGASRSQQRPRANQGQTGTPWTPRGPPRAPAQGHPASCGRGGGEEPDLPAVGGGGDRPGPSHGSASASRRGRGGARGCGAGKGPGKGRRRRPRGGAGAGPDFPARRPRLPAETRAVRVHDEAAPGAERLRQRVRRTHRRGPRRRAEVRRARGAERAGASRLGSCPTDCRALGESWGDSGVAPLLGARVPEIPRSLRGSGLGMLHGGRVQLGV